MAGLRPAGGKADQTDQESRSLATGSIPVKGFVLLQDDKRLQLADNIVAIVRNQYATGEVATVLNDIDAKLTTADLIDLNRRADVNHEDPDALAVGWLRDHAFLKRTK